jgi:hypothetical protein
LAQVGHRLDVADAVEHCPARQNRLRADQRASRLIRIPESELRQGGADLASNVDDSLRLANLGHDSPFAGSVREP